MFFFRFSALPWQPLVHAPSWIVDQSQYALPNQIYEYQIPLPMHSSHLSDFLRLKKYTYDHVLIHILNEKIFST